jgi:opacity protein-like surface antigen
VVFWARTNVRALVVPARTAVSTFPLENQFETSDASGLNRPIGLQNRNPRTKVPKVLAVGGVSKMRSVILLTLLLCLPGAAASETYQSTWYGYVDGLMSLPSAPSEFKDRWKPGFGGGFGAGLQVTPWVTVVGHIDGNFFSADDETFVSDLGLDSYDGGSMSIGHAWVGGRAHVSYPDPEVKFMPYLTGGVGLIRTKTNTQTFVSGGTTTRIVTFTDIAFAASAGFGVDYQMFERSRIFVDVQAVLGLTEDDTLYFPIRLGFSFRIAAGPYL